MCSGLGSVKNLRGPRGFLKNSFQEVVGIMEKSLCFTFIELLFPK
jgi:hypothetical protein